MSFEIQPGATESPVVLHVPHGSRDIPPQARERILLDDDQLRQELDLITDSHTGLIASRAAEDARVRPWSFVNTLSRLVVDPERFPDEREEMRAVGMAAVYLSTSHQRKLRNDDPRHTEDLLAHHYRPYAKAMTDIVDERPIILDVHSYPSRPLPYELHATSNRPAICLGVDDFHTPAWLREAAAEAFAAVGDVDVNTPFSGAYVPLKHYRQSQNVASLMIEIRRDTYMAEPGGAPHDGIDAVVRALTRLIDACQSAPLA
ncbi:N-formylglutamate amidohydrolase [Fodinicola acaciae]|uniref:N-formylglutamate amidohydrolase n=1 Tax=Fodinicola acaciae TaxID=2681555 RepID=UPI0013D80034|nr:N-formylglutamate amidohydrolase [Fodinicola acaciae]